jgi:hypothetical protein
MKTLFLELQTWSSSSITRIDLWEQRHSKPETGSRNKEYPSVNTSKTLHDHRSRGMCVCTLPSRIEDMGWASRAKATPSQIWRRRVALYAFSLCVVRTWIWESENRGQRTKKNNERQMERLTKMSKLQPRYWRHTKSLIRKPYLQYRNIYLQIFINILLGFYHIIWNLYLKISTYVCTKFTYFYGIDLYTYAQIIWTNRV